jgi:hypothetical protein
VGKFVRGLRSREAGAGAGRVAALVRTALALEASDIVTVAELRCGVPGCPPVETVALILRGAAHYRLRVFKPLAEVGAGDLPPAWYLPALADEGEPDCGCC